MTDMTDFTTSTTDLVGAYRRLFLENNLLREQLYHIRAKSKEVLLRVSMTLSTLEHVNGESALEEESSLNGSDEACWSVPPHKDLQ